MAGKTGQLHGKRRRFAAAFTSDRPQSPTAYYSFGACEAVFTGLFKACLRALTSKHLSGHMGFFKSRTLSLQLDKITHKCYLDGNDKTFFDMLYKFCIGGFVHKSVPKN